VGDNGEILTTTDTGNTWVVTHVGAQNLRALSIIDPDTAWAVGDKGTLLKKSGNTWSAMSALSNDNLTSIHFLDPEDGVIGTNGAFYFYDSGAWVRNPINSNVGAVYYVAPQNVYFAGTNGNIIEYNPLNCDTLSQDSTYSTQTINSLYFLNANVGYAAGDSGSSFVTYDGGFSWATMAEFPNTATSTNFWSITGHGATNGTMFNYNGHPSPLTGIVRGRITYGNPPVAILGAAVERFHIDTGGNSYYYDTAYTNEQGNFVFAGVDSLTYEFGMSFMDSDKQKTKLFPNILVQPGEVVILNYNDYVAPMAVNSIAQPNLSLYVNASESFAQIAYSIPSDGNARLVMQDILGRTVRIISDGFQTQGIQETDVALDDLPAGVYYVTLESGEGSLTKKLAVVH